jgi:ABC-type branched-subunit amino acid transport system ATPase component/branched-subunit amino acid ABC-type transport system permease component
MTFLQFVVLGLGLGGLYALSGQGIVLIYRGSGVVNFSQGAIGATAAYGFYELHDNGLNIPFTASFPLVVLGSGLLGGLIYFLVMRPLRNSSALVRLVATLGILAILQSLLLIRYGSQALIVPSFYSQTIVHLGAQISIGVDQLIIIATAVAVTGVLWFVYKKTSFGLATSAVAENQRAAAALGWSPDLIAGANWILGAALGGLSGVLLFPVVTLSVTSLTNVVLAALAVALIANFRSFPVTLIAGLVIGAAESVLGRYTTVPGLANSVPVFVIVLWLMSRGATLPERGSALQRLPELGTGRVNWLFVVLGVAISLALIFTLPLTWTNGFTTTFGMGLVLLSIVVVSGYAGQLSLCQFALAGTGAYIAGRLVAAAHVPFSLALVIGVIGAVPVGALIALPAVRLRGINLAIATLGLGLVIELMVFDNPSLVGGFVGTNIGEDRSFLGIAIDPIATPRRYAVFALILFVLGALAVAKIRRSRLGGRFIAVRTNERAAASIGVNLAQTKLAAFAIGSALAALGGIILAFSATNINYSGQFDYTNSFFLMGYAVIGGLGYVSGSFVGATFATGAIGTVIVSNLISSQTVASYVPLVGGVLLIVILLTAPEGSAGLNSEMYRSVTARLRRGATEPVELEAAADELVPHSVEQRELTATGLSVSFGGTKALDGLSLVARPGEVLGVIGPNGAGKTTLIDAISGFVTCSGALELNGFTLDNLPAAQRSKRGVTRSFQSLELFEDVSVRENLAIAGGSKLQSAHNVRAPAGLTVGAAAAVREFGLQPDLNTRARDLPYGRRRLVAIARALANSPSIVLLDEPAAGLDSNERLELGRLIARLAAEWGIGFVVVEHNMDFVMNLCSRIIVLEFGRKIAEGTPEEIRGNSAVVEAYLGTPDSVRAEVLHDVVTEA